MAKDLFSPRSTIAPNHSPNNSSQRITLPSFPLLFDPNYLDQLLPARPLAKAEVPKDEPTHAFASALKVEANKTTTENLSPAFVSTESPTLDAFSTLDPNTSGGEIHNLLDKSWREDPDLTLKIIFHLRSIHDGKSARLAFYRAFGWLYQHHPRTAIASLHLLVDLVCKKKAPKKGLTSGDDESDWTRVDKKDSAPDIEMTGYSHGYYKDLLNILALATADELTPPSSQFAALEHPRPNHSIKGGIQAQKRRKERQATKKEDIGNLGKPATLDKTAARVKAKEIADGEASRSHKSRTYQDNHERIIKKLEPKRDPSYQALYITVTRIFGLALASDIKILQKLSDPSVPKEERLLLKWQLSFASKWAPTPNCSHDRLSNISTAIAAFMYINGDLDGLALTNGTEMNQENAAIVRNYYRRWIVMPLRRFAAIPETSMTLKEWDKINYSRVASACFSKNKSNFFKHDEARLLQFLKSVQEGARTISGATLAPHELLMEALSDKTQSKDPLEARLAETSSAVATAQWNTMVDRIRQSGALENSLAVCDVSGSMGSIFNQPSGRKSSDQVQPIFPSVALSLLLAQIAAPPFQNMFITFSESPKIVTVDTRTGGLSEWAKAMSTADWGQNTDFNAVFLDLILPMALEHKIKRDEMIKRLFVFSDMQFDEACLEPQGSDPGWETNHQLITRKFEEAGYDVPEIVYWNLAGRASAAKPVTKDTPGVAMVSGFSGNLLKVFMENGEIGLEESEEEWSKVGEGEEVVAVDAEVKTKKKKMDPISVMKKALGLKSFSALKVED